MMVTLCGWQRIQLRFSLLFIFITTISFFFFLLISVLQWVRRGRRYHFSPVSRSIRSGLSRIEKFRSPLLETQSYWRSSLGSCSKSDCINFSCLSRRRKVRLSDFCFPGSFNFIFSHPLQAQSDACHGQWIRLWRVSWWSLFRTTIVLAVDWELSKQ